LRLNLGDALDFVVEYYGKKIINVLAGKIGEPPSALPCQVEADTWASALVGFDPGVAQISARNCARL